MTDRRNRRRVAQQQRLQHQLEVQARQIEKVFSQHHLPTQVAGGAVESRSVRFDLQAQLAQGWERLQGLTQELVTALGALDVRLSQEEGQWRLHVTRQGEPAVALLDLLSLFSDLPPVTAVLGLAEDGRPVVLRFVEEEVTHVLVSGGNGAGKTILLRTLAVSLALMNKQSRLQLLVIDPETAQDKPAYTELEPLNYLPHLLAPVIYNLDEAVEVLDFLVKEMAYRIEQSVAAPTIIVLIDKIVTLLEAGGQAALDAVTRLAQRGAGAGIHLVLSTYKPEAALLDRMLRANLPVRVVGQMHDERQARAAAGIDSTQAEYLLGQGDFLAVAGDEVTRFQAAYIGDYDLHLALEAMYRQRSRALLARPFNIRPALAPEPETDEPQAQQRKPRQFVFDGASIALTADGWDEETTTDDKASSSTGYSYFDLEVDE